MLLLFAGGLRRKGSERRAAPRRHDDAIGQSGSEENTAGRAGRVHQPLRRYLHGEDRGRENGKVWEFNLRFKTDSSKDGPFPGRPSSLRRHAGRPRLVVFASPKEISEFIRQSCQ